MAKTNAIAEVAQKVVVSGRDSLGIVHRSDLREKANLKKGEVN